MPVRINRESPEERATEGLNPDEWFGNVEFVIAREIGQQTVRYVSNIYKYYVAYKLILEQLKQPPSKQRLSLWPYREM